MSISIKIRYRKINNALKNKWVAVYQQNTLRRPRQRAFSNILDFQLYSLLAHKTVVSGCTKLLITS